MAKEKKERKKETSAVKQNTSGHYVSGGIKTGCPGENGTGGNPKCNSSNTAESPLVRTSMLWIFLWICCTICTTNAQQIETIEFEAKRTLNLLYYRMFICTYFTRTGRMKMQVRKKIKYRGGGIIKYGKIKYDCAGMENRGTNSAPIILRIGK